MRNMVCRICGISLLMSTVSASALAASIGVVVDVVREGYRTPPGANELPAQPADELLQGEGLRTGPDSAIFVRFSDGSEMSLEAESEILLSDYVFEPVNGADGTIMLGEGLFHFNSNGAEDSNVELQTPVATIGIRGTEFLVTSTKTATIVDIVDGAVELRPRGGGKSMTCEGGQSAMAASADADVICGDFGSFATAAGVPAAPQTIAQGHISDRDKDAGSRPTGRSGGGSSGGGDPGGGDPGGGDPGGGDPGGGDPGGGDPGGGGNPGNGNGNHSGLGDGSNPGKGHGNGNGNGSGGGNGGNGGANNPGGGRK